MINTESVSAVDRSTYSAAFRKPLYESYCFSNIPQTVLHLLGHGESGLPKDVIKEVSPPYRNVILLFLDAFGWQFLHQHAETSPVLQKLIHHGTISKLTAQFPSTTAAHVTTIHTGLSVGQHGVYEWNYYEPQVDAVIQPLLFSYAGDTARDTLKNDGVDPAHLFPPHTIYQSLAEHGIPSHVFQPAEVAYTAHSAVVTDGATIHPYATLAEGLLHLANQVLQSQGGYHYLYYGGIDTTGHKYGPDSVQFTAEVNHVLQALEHQLLDNLEGKSLNTLLLMTADHGQVDSDPAHCFYVNQRIPELIPLLQTTHSGSPIVPVGSARNFFLHVKTEHLQEAHHLLTEKLHGIAEVHLVSDLITDGLFGQLPLSPTFLSRVGNLVILPYAGHSVWWYEEGKFSQTLVGHHGGLTPEEMDTVLCAYEL